MRQRDVLLSAGLIALLLLLFVSFDVPKLLTGYVVAGGSQISSSSISVSSAYGASSELISTTDGSFANLSVSQASPAVLEVEFQPQQTVPANSTISSAVLTFSWLALQTATPTPAPTEAETPTPAPTETPAPSEIATETPTETAIPSPTETVSPTPSESPTASETPSPTVAPSETPTATPVPTETPTPTPSETPIPSPTQILSPYSEIFFDDLPTASISIWDGSSYVPVPSCTSISISSSQSSADCDVSSVLSATPQQVKARITFSTSSGTSTVSVDSVTLGVSYEQAATPTPSETSTPVPSMTESPTPTETITPAPTANATETPSPSPTLIPTPNATITPTPNATVSPSPTANETLNETANASITPTPSATPVPEANTTVLNLNSSDVSELDGLKSKLKQKNEKIRFKSVSTEKDEDEKDGKKEGKIGSKGAKEKKKKSYSLQLSFNSTSGREAFIAIDGLESMKDLKDLQSASFAQKLAVSNGSGNFLTDVFALNSINISSAVIYLPKNSDSNINAILTCSDSNWDFNLKACAKWEISNSSFQQNGTFVWFNVSHFSAYGGGNITVLNIQSYPIVGGNWSVIFNTTGTADLSVTAINGTSFGHDLQFLQLKCGSTVLNSTYNGTAVSYANYSCAQNGTEISKVLTPGSHHLQLNFGDSVAYAHNLASISSCTDLNTENQYYTLSANTTAPASGLKACMNVTANNVTLDCQGYSITANNSGLISDVVLGVNVSRIANATIKNCWISNFTYGIFGLNADSLQVSNSTILNPSPGVDGVYTIYFKNVTNSRFFNSYVNSSHYQYSFGVEAGVLALIEYSSNNEFFNNTLISSAGIGSPGAFGWSTFASVAWLNNSISNNSFYSNNITSNGGGFFGRPSITVAASIGVNLTNLNIYNNNFTRPDYDHYYGPSILELGDLYNVRIYNNSFWLGVDSGSALYLYASRNGSISGNNITSFDSGLTGTGTITSSGAYAISLLNIGTTSSTNNSIFNNNVTNLNDTSGGAIILLGSGGLAPFNNSIYNNIFEAKAIAIHLAGAVNNLFANNTIVPCVNGCNADYRDVYMRAMANNTFLNTSMNMSRLVFLNNAFKNNITVQWYADVNVTNSSGLMQGALVNISDALYSRNYSLSTDANGRIGYQIVTEFMANNTFTYNGGCVNQANLTCYSPHQINVTNAGVQNSTLVNITSSGVYGISFEVSSCRALSSSYSMTQNLTSSVACFNITANNVVLDCNGYSIISNTTSAPAGVYVNGVNNTIIRNCIISNYSNAVWYGASSANSSIYNNSIRVPAAADKIGINIGADFSNGSIYNNTITALSTFASDSFPAGILFNGNGSANNQIYNNTINSTGASWTAAVPIYFLLAGNNNSIFNNTILANGGWGVLISYNSQKSNFTRIYDNFINTTSSSTTTSALEVYSNNNSIFRNRIYSGTGTGAAVWLSSANNNSIFNNTLSSIAGIALSLGGGGKHIVYSNDIFSNNTIGLYLSSSSAGNAIYANNLTSNSSVSSGVPALQLSPGYNNTIYNNNITALWGTNNYALVANSGSANNVFYGNSYSARNMSIRFNNAINNTFTNETIVYCASGCSSPYYDVYVMNAAANNTFLNVSFNRSAVLWQAGTSVRNLTVQWLADANLTNSSGQGISGATVNISNSSGQLIYSLTTGADGRIGYRTITEFIANGTFDYNGSCISAANLSCSTPHTASVQIAGSSDIYANTTNVTGNIVFQLNTLSSGCGSLTSSVSLQSNVTANGTSCLNITSANVEINCNGYGIIGNNSANTSGIFSNSQNTTVKNCYIENFTNAIFFLNANNGTINNNTILVNANTTALPTWLGIYLNASGSNNITNNAIPFVAANVTTAYSPAAILIATNSHFNRIVNNNFNASKSNSAYGIHLLTTNSFNLIENNTGNASQDAIKLTSSVNDTIRNNTLLAIGGAGLFLLSGGNNSMENNTVVRAVIGMDFSASSANVLLNNNFTGTAYAVRFIGVQNNTFIGGYLKSGTTIDIQVQNNAVNNTFLNVTFNRSRINFVAATVSNVSVKWYADFNITNSSSSPISGAAVNLSNVSDSRIFSVSTASNGRTGWMEVTEFILNGTGYTYNDSCVSNGNLTCAYPYIINATSDLSYLQQNSTSINISASQIVQLTLYNFSVSYGSSAQLGNATINAPVNWSDTVTLLGTDSGQCNYTSLHSDRIGFLNVFNVTGQGISITNASEWVAFNCSHLEDPYSVRWQTPAPLQSSWHQNTSRISNLTLQFVHSNLTNPSNENYLNVTFSCFAGAVCSQYPQISSASSANASGSGDWLSENFYYYQNVSLNTTLNGTAFAIVGLNISDGAPSNLNFTSIQTNYTAKDTVWTCSFGNISISSVTVFNHTNETFGSCNASNIVIASDFATLQNSTYWTRNVTMNNTDSDVSYVNITGNLSLNDSINAIAFDESFKVWNGTGFVAATPSSSQTNCNSSSPSYSEFNISNLRWRVCKQDTNANGVPDYFSFIIPNASNSSSLIAQLSGMIPYFTLTPANNQVVYPLTSPLFVVNEDPSSALWLDSFTITILNASSLQTQTFSMANGSSNSESSQNWTYSYTFPNAPPQGVSVNVIGRNGSSTQHYNKTISLRLTRSTGQAVAAPRFAGFYSNTTYLQPNENATVLLMAELDTLLDSISINITAPNGSVYSPDPVNITSNSSSYLYNYTYWFNATAAGNYTLFAIIADVNGQRVNASSWFFSAVATNVNVSSVNFDNLEIRDAFSDALFYSNQTVSASMPPGKYEAVFTGNKTSTTLMMADINGTTSSLFNFTEVTEARTPPANRRSIDEFLLTPNTTYSSATVTYNYSSILVTLSDENNVRIYKCPSIANCTSAASWLLLNSTVNNTLHTVTANVSSFSLFLIAESSYPVPQVSVQQLPGGSSTTNTLTQNNVTTVIQNQSVKLEPFKVLFFPGVLEMYSKDAITAPMVLRNTLNITLYGITLNASTESPDLSLKLSQLYFYSIAPGETVTANLSIESHSRIGLHNITVSAKVESINFTDTGILVISLVNNRTFEGNLSQLITMMNFASSLFKSNPECLEFSELLVQANQSYSKGDFNKARSFVSSAVDGCRAVLAQLNKPFEIRKTEATAGPEWWVMGATGLALVSGILLVFFMLRKPPAGGAAKGRGGRSRSTGSSESSGSESEGGARKSGRRKIWWK